MWCANPECRLESSYLRSGCLYWIDEHPANGEVTKGRFIWLCRMCIAEFVVETWRPPGQQIQRRSSAHAGTPPKPVRSEATDISGYKAG